MGDSAAFLRDYVASGSEEAFAEVVKNHVDLVHSSALRIVAGDAHLARDVAQMVFTDLAQASPSLSRLTNDEFWCHINEHAVRSKISRRSA